MSDFLAFLLDVVFKTSLVLGAAFLASFALRRRSAALRHSMWTAALIAVVLMPALAAYIPLWRSDFKLSTLTMFSPPLTRTEAADPDVAATTSDSGESLGLPNQSSLATLVWFVGFLCITAILIREAARLARVASGASPFFDSRWYRMVTDLQRRLGMKRAVRLVQSPTASMLVTWGAVRPRVLLPSGADSWAELRVQAVLGHELAHIRRHDWFVQLIGEIARAVYWFNPLVWFACDRLRQESERACDDVVLRLGVESTEYAAELLDLARMLKTSSCSWAPSLAMAHASTLERRFAAMLNPSADRRSISIKTAFLVGIITLSLSIPIGAMRAPFQAQTGRLFGRVYDPTGAPIKNATITMYDDKMYYFAFSNESGVFEFPRLAAGQYELKTLAAGFESFQIHAVSVDPGQEVNLNIVTVAASPASPAAKSAAQQTAPPSGGGVQPPRLIHQVPAVYPAELKSAGVSGNVLLDVTVDTDGTPKSAQVVNSSINSDLASAAIDAVKQWHWQPATKDGQPTQASTRVSVNFQLAGARGERGSAGTSPSAEVLAARKAELEAAQAQSNSQQVGQAKAEISAKSVLPDEPPPPPPQRIRQGGNVQQANLVTQVKPVYPHEAKEQRIQGVVILEALISTQGDVESIKVISGNELLQQAAIDAVSQWKYKPTLLNGQPVEVVTTVTVNFSFQP